MPADHYRTLNVAPNAEAEVVRAAYLALMRKHHPDRTGDDVHARARVQEISAAFAVLGDPLKRSDYDRQQGRATATASPPRRAPTAARRPAPPRGPSLESRRRRLRRVRWASLGLFVTAVGLVAAGAAGVWAQIG